MLEHFSFTFSGVQLSAAFDIRPELIGTNIGNMTVKAAKDMAQFQDEFHPGIAILCVPRDIANETTNELADNVIRGIWNFTNKELTRKAKNIFVENVHFTDSLLVLNYYFDDSLKSQKKDKKTQRPLN